MARYPLGQPVTIPVTVRDGTGALVDAGTLTVLVKLAQADGTQLTTGTYASPAHDSLGTYHQDIPVTDLAVTGHYQYTATSTGTGAGVAVGDFDVYDPFETSVLPLQDAKAQLNIPLIRHRVRQRDTELHRHDRVLPGKGHRRAPGQPGRHRRARRDAVQPDGHRRPAAAPRLRHPDHRRGRRPHRHQRRAETRRQRRAHPQAARLPVLRAVLQLAPRGLRRLHRRVGRLRPRRVQSASPASSCRTCGTHGAAPSPCRWAAGKW